ncbi:uncharacterized protein [Nicotiana sylvestris]|uniref:uncharacterized protein n=1 Tax=Nicotiana sylvestris TaxID=4096 RepID=UPI00388CA8DC
MARTCTSSSADQQPEPLMVAPTRGRGRGRGRGMAQHRARAATPATQPHVDFDDEAVGGSSMSSEALLRFDKFTKLLSVHYSGAASEDTQDYLDYCHEVLRNMGIVETNRVDFVVFQMIGSAKRWWNDFMLTIPAGSPALTWDQFSQLFHEKFLPVTQREDYRRWFEHLQQGFMTVTQYETRFVYLARHALLILPT